MESEDAFHKQFTEPELTDRARPPPVPKKIGPYKIEALLDRGGMGWLYMGKNLATQETVAIKVLPTNRLKDEQSIKQFLEESRLIGMASHENIVKLYEEGRWDGGLYIAMEWIQGISLKEFLSKKEFSLRRSLYIIIQICEALKHLHSHHIIHRDLKPENILITEEGRVKVIDFGIAQMIKTDKQPSSKVAGTPNYMSPEQKKSPQTVSFTSDIYSLGVLAYELILGKLSFGVIQTSLLPRELGKIINKALATSVKERYQTVDAFLADLSAYIHSKKIDQEKPAEDCSMEVFESLESASLTLTPSTISASKHIDIGIGKIFSSAHFGLYYDILPLKNGGYFFFLADPKEQNLSGLLAASTLKGAIRALFEKMDFTAFSFIEALNSIKKVIEKDPSLKEFAISALYLEPEQNQLSFFNAGLSHLICLPAKEESLVIYNSHPLMQQIETALDETKASWHIGDILVLHTLAAECRLEPKEQTEIETKLRHTLKIERFLLAQAQADALVQLGKQHKPIQKEQRRKVLLVIQRIV